MDAQNDCPEYSREPTLDDLVLLCRHLNETGVKYVVIGGFAIILSGYIRTTGDIDLLVDSSSENVERIKKALLASVDFLKEFIAFFFDTQKNNSKSC
jgi:putative cell wall-binding protein